MKAQNKDYEGYEMALREIRNGRKQTHWIWYIFPQMSGLGHSWNSNYYGIKDLEEAREYVEHPILGERLIEITEALLALEETKAEVIMNGYTDARKLKSSMTLFSIAAPQTEVFEQVLDKLFRRKRDYRTINMLKDK